MVMFRDFAARKAKTLGLKGTVENLSNGNVYVIAEGEEEDLNKYIKKLSKGSIFSRIDKVNTVWHEPTNNFTKFDVIYYDRR